MSSSPDENAILQKQATNLNQTIRRNCYLNGKNAPTYVIIGRVKTKYSLERKIGIREVLDKFAYTIICRSEKECFSMLEILKDNFELVYTKDGKTTEKDYINLPKPNGYKSIHIGLKASDGTIIEVHIETPQMYRDNNFGEKTNHDAVYKKSSIDSAKAGISREDAKKIYNLFFDDTRYKTKEEIESIIDELAKKYYDTHKNNSVDIYNIIEEFAVKKLGVRILDLLNNNNDYYGILKDIKLKAQFERISRVIIEENGKFDNVQQKLYTIFGYEDYIEYLKKYLEYVKFEKNESIRNVNELLQTCIDSTLPQLKVLGKDGQLYDVNSKSNILILLSEIFDLELGFVGKKGETI